MEKTNEIKDTFSRSLRNCLHSHYGKIPSAAVLARDFNLRAYGTTPITQESARRWIRGVSLPEEGRLRVLVDWLGLDYNAVLRFSDSDHPHPQGNGAALKPPSPPQYGQQFKQGAGGFQKTSTVMHSGNGALHHRRVTDQLNAALHDDTEIANLIVRLDANKRKVVADIIKAIQTQ